MKGKKNSGKVLCDKDYLALRHVCDGDEVIYQCNRLVKLSDGEPLEKIIIENLIFLNIKNIRFDDNDLKEEAKKYDKLLTGNILKKNIILFGTGIYGEQTYRTLKDKYNVIAFADNNCDLRGKNKNDLPIIMGNDLANMDFSDTDIIICIKNYKCVAEQLEGMGIKRYLVMLDGFLFLNDTDGKLYPVELFTHSYYKKGDKKTNILFVQDSACIRTNKIAKIMHEYGFSTFHIYMAAPPSEGNRTNYDAVWNFTSLMGIRNFVMHSEFDVVHVSNEPDVLTNVMIGTGKTVIHDSHDLTSLQKRVNEVEKVFEYRANIGSDAVIQTTEGVYKIAQSLYKRDKKSVFVLPNLVEKEAERHRDCKKLSASDGQIHLVYEGSLEDGGNTADGRFFEDIWKKIADSGVHIHFYSQANYNYCKQLDSANSNIHYEGNLSSKELIEVLPRYDAGIAVYNINAINRKGYETASPNKLSEYLNAGIPIITGNVRSFSDFVKKYQVGIELNLCEDIKRQIVTVKNIEVPEGFLTSNLMTMESRKKDLAEFYKKVYMLRSKPELFIAPKTTSAR